MVVEVPAMRDPAGGYSPPPSARATEPLVPPNTDAAPGVRSELRFKECASCRQRLVRVGAEWWHDRPHVEGLHPRDCRTHNDPPDEAETADHIDSPGGAS